MRKVSGLVGVLAMGLWCVSAAMGAMAGAKAAAPAADEWPCWQGPEHDNKSPDKGLLKEWPAGGPKLIWQATGIGRGFSTVSVSGDKVYTSGDLNGRLTVFAFDMTGKQLFKIDIDNEFTNQAGSRSTPTIDSGKLYIISGHGIVGCFDAATGAKVWSRTMREFGGGAGGWGYAESVLIQGNGALVKPGGQNCIVALNKATGATIWTSKGFSGGPEYGSITPFTFGGEACLVAGTAGGIACFDANTGTALWSNGFSSGDTANCPTPAYSDGHVFWATGYGKGGICFRLAQAGGKVTATQAWTSGEFDCYHGGYVIDNGYIYGNAGGGWICVDLKTGQRKWRDNGVGKGSLCWADGMLYLFSENNGLAGLATATPDKFEMKGKFNVKGSGPSWAHPVVVGGRLYLRYDTNLYCFDVKAQ